MLRAVVRDVIACVGSVLDRSTKPGISQEKIDAFFADAQAFAAWQAAARANAAAVLPLGPEGTPAAAAAVAAIKGKVDDSFARCRLVAVDPRAAPARPIIDAKRSTWTSRRRT